MSRIPADQNLVIDVSYHQKINYDVVAPHIRGAIIRVAYGDWIDPAFAQHYAEFMARNVPCAAYQWFRPDQDVTKQIEAAKIELDKTEINIVLSDQEQHGLGASSLPPYYNPGVLSTKCEAHVTGMELHGFEMGTYSRSTWIMEHCAPSVMNVTAYPNNKPWRYNYIVWLASWPFASGGITCSWETLESTWAPTLFSPYFASGWPGDSKYADIWQWSGDKFILPGITTPNGQPRAVDLNYVPDYLLAKFLKKEEQAPVPEPQPPTDTSLHDEIRLVLRELLDQCNMAEQDLLDLINKL